MFVMVPLHLENLVDERKKRVFFGKLALRRQFSVLTRSGDDLVAMILVRNFSTKPFGTKHTIGAHLENSAHLG